MTIHPKKFRLILLAAIVIVLTINYTYQNLIDNAAYNTWTIKRLQEILGVSKFSYLSLARAQSDKMRDETKYVDNIILGNSTVQGFSQAYNSVENHQLLTLHMGSLSVSSIYFLLDEIEGLAPKKIKVLMPIFLLKAPLSYASAEISAQVSLKKFFKLHINLLARAWEDKDFKLFQRIAPFFWGSLENLLFKERAKSTTLSIIYDGFILKQLASKEKTKIIRTAEDVINDNANLEDLKINLVVFKLMADELAEKNIHLYYIEDQFNDSCQGLEQFKNRDFFVNEAKKIDQENHNFTFISKEKVPQLERKYYVDCLHVFYEKADWKNEKLKFLTEI